MSERNIMKTAEALEKAWSAQTPEQKEAVLKLAYHAIDELGSGFESSHAKEIIDMLVTLSRPKDG